jgi:hypothetical protein
MLPGAVRLQTAGPQTVTVADAADPSINGSAPTLVRPGWIQLDPHLGGRLDGILVSPTDSNTLLVASSGGGIWKTTDNGAHWAEKNEGLLDANVVHLEWDKAIPGQIWAVTDSDLYKSADFGELWVNATLLGSPPPPMAYVHSSTFQFAQLSLGEGRAILWGRPCSGLFYSFDGTTFAQTFPAPGGAANTDNCIESIAVDEPGATVLFSAMATLTGIGPHLFRSCAWKAGSACLTWTPWGAGLPLESFNVVLASIGTIEKPARFAALAYADSSLTVFQKDGDQPWVRATADTLAWEGRVLLYGGGSEMFVGAVTSIQSLDLGVHWQRFDADLQHPDVRAFAFSPGYLWTTTDGSIDGSYANIIRWDYRPGTRPANAVPINVAGPSGIAALQLHFVQPIPTTSPSGRRIYLGTQDNYSFCSDDLGLTWHSSAIPNPSGDHYSMAVALSDPSVAYLVSQFSGNVNATRNANAPGCLDVRWSLLTPPSGTAWGYPSPKLVAVHPRDPGRVYFVNGASIGKSVDFARTITTMGTLPATVVSLIVHPSGALYAATAGGVFASSDDGATWSALGLDRHPPRFIRSLAWSPAGGGEGTLYAAGRDGLYRKLPGADFAVPSGFSAKGAVSDVAVDPRCPSRIYAVLGYAFPWLQHGGGVWVSDDNGETWTSLTAGHPLERAPLTHVLPDPEAADVVYVASYGKGAWAYHYGGEPACALASK